MTRNTGIVVIAVTAIAMVGIVQAVNITQIEQTKRLKCSMRWHWVNLIVNKIPSALKRLLRLTVGT